MSYMPKVGERVCVGKLCGGVYDVNKDSFELKDDKGDHYKVVTKGGYNTIYKDSSCHFRGWGPFISEICR